MKTKHTFLFTMLLGLAWAGYLFSYDSGPAATGAGMANGVLGAGTTCNQPGCHSTGPLNSGGTLVALEGLPAQWVPGTTYPLTVRVQRTAALYGFQLSAVFDSTNPPRQAGTLSKGAVSGTTDFSRISIGVDQPTGLQYAEHNQNNNFLAPTSTFFVNWTAPSSASGGTVRFNVAANAANRDGNNTGDFIYARVDKVSPATASPDFSISGSPSSSVTAGNSTTVNFIATGANGFNGTVNLTVDGLPCGASASFSPSSIPAPAGSTLTISTLTGARTGVFSLTITATSGSLTHTTTLSLTIAPPGSPIQNFSVVNFGGVSLATSGGCDQVSGYVRIQHDAGSSTPSGVEIFGFTKNNILVSETGVTASPLMTEGRIYAEENGPLSTGVAIANPNAQAANIQYVYTDSSGNSTAPKPLIIPPNSQFAHFLFQSEFLPGLPVPLQGAFSFTSDVPVSVIALRGLTNADGDFLMSTLPVIDTSAPGGNGVQVLPHFATGDGWTTQVFLVNPGTATLTGSLQFIDGNGAPINVVVGGQATNTTAYSVAPRSAQKIVVTGPTAGGSIRVVPAGGGAVPTSVVLFSQTRASGVTATEAAAQVSSGTAFRMYVETSDASAGNIDSGIAVANTSSAPATVTLELFKLDGTSAGLPPVSLTLKASEKTATFVSQQFSGLPKPFKGILRISSSATLSVAGLRSRNNQRPQPDFLITTTPISLETAAPSAAEVLFPHLVDGDGYTTQFILFSGTAGRPAPERCSSLRQEESRSRSL